jgi:hypothetical protein
MQSEAYKIPQADCASAGSPKYRSKCPALQGFDHSYTQPIVKHSEMQKSSPKA